MVDDERGQALTLEAVTAGLILLSAIGFALQMTAVTPLSASTSSQHLENQLRYTASGVLASAEETGALSRAVRYWNDTNGKFWDSGDADYYTNEPPNNALGNAFNRTFDERNVAYNVILVYQTSGGLTEQARLIYRGQPTDHAVRISRTVTIMDRDPLIDADGSVNGTVTVSDANTYFLQDASPGEPIRNVVQVKVVAWRI
jgi:hypothetical protein